MTCKNDSYREKRAVSFDRTKPRFKTGSGTFAIAVLTVRSAVHSRLFASLACVLLVLLLGLPWAIKGDGTVTGHVKILLGYGLWLTAFILAAATLWASCGLISEEIDNRRIQLVAAKPVHRFQIWIGKWLGLTILNAVLLLVAGGAIYGSVKLSASVRKADAADRQELRERVLTGRRRLSPRTAKLEQAVRKQFNDLPSRIKTAAGTDEAAFRKFRRSRLAAFFTAKPGAEVPWRFNIDRGYSGTPLLLRYRFTSFLRDVPPVSGTWSLQDASGETLWKTGCSDRLDGVNTLGIPSRFATRSGMLKLVYCNTDSRNRVVIFNPEKPPELLVTESGFGTNLIRSLVVLACHLGLLAALGLTAGTVFSFPVAVFTACSIIMISAMTHYFTFASHPGRTVHHHHGHAPEPPSRVTVAWHGVIRRADSLIAPAMRLDPVTPLTDGLLVSPAMTLKAFLILMCAYPALLGALAGIILNRRELALPAK
ncbi:MAG: ABC transporter permease [Kiritimatiellia bacterium]